MVAKPPGGGEGSNIARHLHALTAASQYGGKGQLKAQGKQIQIPQNLVGKCQQGTRGSSEVKALKFYSSDLAQKFTSLNPKTQKQVGALARQAMANLATLERAPGADAKGLASLKENLHAILDGEARTQRADLVEASLANLDPKMRAEQEDALREQAIERFADSYDAEMAKAKEAGVPSKRPLQQLSDKAKIREFCRFQPLKKVLTSPISEALTASLPAKYSESSLELVKDMTEKMDARPSDHLQQILQGGICQGQVMALLARRALARKQGMTEEQVNKIGMPTGSQERFLHLGQQEITLAKASRARQSELPPKIAKLKLAMTAPEDHRQQLQTLDTSIKKTQKRIDTIDAKLQLDGLSGVDLKLPVTRSGQIIAAGLSAKTAKMLASLEKLGIRPPINAQGRLDKVAIEEELDMRFPVSGNSTGDLKEMQAAFKKSHTATGKMFNESLNALNAGIKEYDAFQRLGEIARDLDYIDMDISMAGLGISGLEGQNELAQLTEKQDALVK